MKTTEVGGPRGFDASKTIEGRKRHAMVDVDGLAMTLQVHSADVQDHDGATPCSRYRSDTSYLPRLLSLTPPTPPSVSRAPPTSRSRSCARSLGRSASRSTRGAEWSTAALPNSIAIAGW
ncbi:MAG: transposase [Janthinobacterium lividum]